MALHDCRVTASGVSPVWWSVWDAAVSTRSAAAPIPGPEDACWEARYESDCERGKRTTRQFDLLPDDLAGAVRAAVHALTAPAVVRACGQWLGHPCVLDETMHGGGLHVTAPGGVLACHLDYAQHPHRAGMVRCLNLLAFIHPEWRPEWGGELYLAAPSGEPLVAVEPRPGRVVAFEVNDLSYHGVAPVAADAAERVSLAAYLLACGTHTRARAQFFPPRGTFEWPAPVLRV